MKKYFLIAISLLICFKLTAAEIEINTYTDLCDALKNRVAYFDKNGSKLSDHGLEHIYFENFTENEINSIFKKKRENAALTNEEALKFQSAILLFLSETYHEFGWVQQFHLGALRNNNARMHSILGPDTGWDSIGDYSQAQKLSAFLTNSLIPLLLPEIQYILILCRKDSYWSTFCLSVGVFI